MEKDKQLSQILERLDYIILNEETSPIESQIQKVERVAIRSNQLQTQANKHLASLLAVAKVDTAETGKAFNRLHLETVNSSNRMKTAFKAFNTNLHNINTNLQGNLSTIDKGLTSINKNLKSIQRVDPNGDVKLIGKLDDLIRTQSSSEKHSKDLNHYLTRGEGDRSLLTVSSMRGLFRKESSLEYAWILKDRRLARKYHDELTAEVSRRPDTGGNNLDAFVDGAVGKHMGLIATLLRRMQAGVSSATSGLVKLVPWVGALTGALKRGVQSLSIGNITAPLMGLGNKLGMMVRTSMLTMMRGALSTVARAVAVMLNPVALVGMLAGYGVYKLFEDEFDQLFTAIGGILFDPEKRSALLGIVGESLDAMWSDIKDWFVGIEDALDEVATTVTTQAKKSVRKLIHQLEQTVKSVVGIADNIIGTVMSIPDYLELMAITLNGLLLGFKQSASKIPGMGYLIDEDELARDLEANETKKSNIKARIEARKDETYVADGLGVAIGYLKDGTQVFYDAATGVYKNIEGQAIAVHGGISDSIDGFSKKVERFSDSLEVKPVPVQKVVTHKAIEHEAKASKQREMEQMGAVLNQNNVSTVVSTSSSDNHYNVPLSVGGDAKFTGTRSSTVN